MTEVFTVPAQLSEKAGGGAWQRAGLPIPFTIQQLFLLLFAASAFASAQPVNGAQLDEGLLEQRLRLVDASVPERFRRLRTLLQQAGCNELREQTVKKSNEPNLICSIPANEPGARTIIIGAHFDFKGGIGVVDNWTGVILLPTLAELMLKQPRRHHLKVIGFASEERGLWGSKTYAKAMTDEERDHTAAFLGIDALGLQSTKYWPRGSTQELAQIAYQVADSMKLELGQWNLNGLGTTDSESFRKIGIPVLSFHSLTREKWKMINSANDVWDAISWKDYWDSARLIAAVLVKLDQQLP